MSDTPARRVVITGVGLVSPLGNSKAALWDALIGQRSGVALLRSIPTDYLPTKVGGEARDFTGDIEGFGPLDANLKRAIRKGLKVMCREIQMGVAAAQQALLDAGLQTDKYNHDRTGVVYGSDYIMTLPDEFKEGIEKCIDGPKGFQFHRWAEDGLPKVTPLWLLKYLPNMPASHIAIYNDLRGPNNSITQREASANLAIAEAFCTLQRGSADILLVGATGTRIHPMRSVHVVLQEQVAQNGADPTKVCRPFDRRRTGLVLGEGAGAIILEELEAAKARGANILAEVIGYGSSTVLDRRGVPDTTAAIGNVLQQALRSSGLTPDAVGHLHAHGLSTRQCDAEEAQAIQKVFGSRAVPVPVVAAKSYFGNLGAGSGLVELIASVLALQQDSLVPILNYEEPDPDCPITPAQMGQAAGSNFINVNISPQGQAAAVVVRSFPGH